MQESGHILLSMRQVWMGPLCSVSSVYRLLVLPWMFKPVDAAASRPHGGIRWLCSTLRRSSACSCRVQQ